MKKNFKVSEWDNLPNLIQLGFYRVFLGLSFIGLIAILFGHVHHWVTFVVCVIMSISLKPKYQNEKNHPY